MRRGLIVLATVLALVLSCGARASGTDLTAPLAKNGAKWRIGYMEGGVYGNYLWNLKALALGLGKLGWIETPAGFERMHFRDEKELWEWLGANAESRYLEFVKDAFWSAGWDKERRAANKEEAIARFNRDRDLDAVVAMGTWAGQDLANDLHTVPVLVLQSGNAVQSGIVKGTAYSGSPHVFAHCDPGRYKRQVRLFHSLVGFKKLGMAFEDTPHGRVYAAVDDVRDVCRQLGVEVVECHTVTNTTDLSQAVESYRACHERLAGQVDAMYITNSIVVKAETLPGLLEPFKAARVPTFAQTGFDAVRWGALLSISQGDPRSTGMFYARTLSQVLHGVPAGDLPQVFEDTSHFGLNLDTAKAIGFDPPAGLLAAAEVVQSSPGSGADR